MSETDHPEAQRSAAPAQVLLPCSDLDAAITFYTERLGFRLDMIMPADAPRIAQLSGHGITLRLLTALASLPGPAPPTLRLPADAELLSALDTSVISAPDGVRIELVDSDLPLAMPAARQEFLHVRAATDDAGEMGRAGMRYRDLIPGRLGGRFIASHIRIPEGGPVADYVHYHHVRFQMIYCKAGWVRVVYEDQGPPFVMHAGDCVLQPPGIRHRVLESSAGLEVIEIGCPAEHETWRDHDIELPTSRVRPQRDFDGQRFMRHVAAEADWFDLAGTPFEYRDTGIAVATSGLAGVRVLRAQPMATHGDLAAAPRIHQGELLFLMVLSGRVELQSSALGEHTFETDVACVIPSGADYLLSAETECEVLELTLPARDDPS